MNPPNFCEQCMVTISENSACLVLSSLLLSPGRSVTQRGFFEEIRNRETTRFLPFHYRRFSLVFHFVRPPSGAVWWWDGNAIETSSRRRRPCSCAEGEPGEIASFDLGSLDATGESILESIKEVRRCHDDPSRPRGQRGIDAYGLYVDHKLAYSVLFPLFIFGCSTLQWFGWLRLIRGALQLSKYLYRVVSQKFL